MSRLQMAGQVYCLPGASVVDCAVCTPTRMALIPNDNAPLTELARLGVARCVVDNGWPLHRAAELPGRGSGAQGRGRCALRLF